jgi:hypothetical protein
LLCAFQIGFDQDIAFQQRFPLRLALRSVWRS